MSTAPEFGTGLSEFGGRNGTSLYEWSHILTVEMAPKLVHGRFFGRALNQRQMGDLVFVESRHAAGSRLPRHSHEHAYFCLNDGGHYKEQYGRRRRVCRPGMLVFHPPGERHAEEHDSDVSTLNVELSGAWLRRIADFVAPLDQPAEFVNDEIAAAGFHILRELRRDDHDSELAIESLTWEILAASAGRRAVGVYKSAPRWLRDTRDLLDVPSCESMSLRMLAAEAGVHPVHLAATFRRFVGCSIGEYQRRLRFRYACEKLADPDASLAHIAVDAGFADQSHLTRTFKRFTGITPTAYRTFLGFKIRCVTPK
jgi:AraC family transcriptional regulator